MSTKTAIQNAIAALAALPHKTLSNALDATGFYKEVIEEYDDEDAEQEKVEMAQLWVVRPEWIDHTMVIQANGAYNDLIVLHHQAVIDRLNVDLTALANLDASTLERVLAVHTTLRVARTTWINDWKEKVNDQWMPDPQANPAYCAFSKQTLNALAVEHHIPVERVEQADRIHHEWGCTGFDEVMVRFAEARVDQGFDTAHPDMAYALRELVALPTTNGMAERVIAAASSYARATAGQSLSLLFSGVEDVDNDPSYIDVTRAALASNVEHHGVSASQLLHQHRVAMDYYGFPAVRDHHLKALAARVRAIVATNV